MIKITRRSTAHLAVAAVAATTMAGVPLPAAAQELFVPQRYENIKRGTIHSLDPKTRGLVIVGEDLGRVKMKASDLVVRTIGAGSKPSNAYDELQVGQIVEVAWYDYLDFMIAKTTPETTARANAMVASGASIEGIPGSRQGVRLFTMSGMVVKTDLQGSWVEIINASGGEPDAPAPNSGEIIRMPVIRSAEGQAALAQLKPGDMLTTVYSVQTAIRIQIIR